MLDILGRQVASPVQFVKGLHTLYEAGARVFVEVGPKHALQGFVDDVLGDDEVLALFTNHPKTGDLPSFNQALCGLYAAAWASAAAPRRRLAERPPAADDAARAARAPAGAAGPAIRSAPSRPPATTSTCSSAACSAEFLDRSRRALGRRRRGRPRRHGAGRDHRRGARAPGTERIFDDDNLARLLHGEQLHRRDPARPARRDPRQAHHPPGQERRRQRRLRDDRRARTTSSSWRRAPARSTSPRSSASTPSASPRSAATRSSRSRPASTRCATPASRSSCTTRRPPRARKLPDRWALPDELRDDTGVDLRLGLSRAWTSFAGELEPLLDGPRPPRAARRARSRCAPAGRAARAIRAVARGDRPAHRTTLRPSSSGARTTSTGASCSACCRWATRSSPS